MGEGQDYGAGSFLDFLSSLTNRVVAGFGCRQVNSPCGEHKKCHSLIEMHLLSAFRFICIHMQIAACVLCGETLDLCEKRNSVCKQCTVKGGQSLGLDMLSTPEGTKYWPLP